MHWQKGKEPEVPAYKQETLTQGTDLSISKGRRTPAQSPALPGTKGSVPLSSPDSSMCVSIVEGTTGSWHAVQGR